MQVKGDGAKESPNGRGVYAAGLKIKAGFWSVGFKCVSNFFENRVNRCFPQTLMTVRGQETLSFSSNHSKENDDENHSLSA